MQHASLRRILDVTGGLGLARETAPWSVFRECADWRGAPGCLMLCGDLDIVLRYRGEMR